MSAYRLIGSLVVMLLIFTPPAHAYLDPGTGSMIVQATIGLVVGALFTMKLYWHRAKSFFSNLSKRSARTSEEKK